ncbi:unnamed protein product [Pleuronectes platessa]|uniref:Uncharacterized protein n=1 Tax=Pleuronectes platessa TaxID=8262 RepID=A0A9N7TND2_PLEPL|nr:unnamed protein product [Pleuronectes platessa]
MAVKLHPTDLTTSKDPSARPRNQDPLITTLPSAWANEFLNLCEWPKNGLSHSTIKSLFQKVNIKREDDNDSEQEEKEGKGPQHAVSTEVMNQDMDSQIPWDGVSGRKMSCTSSPLQQGRLLVQKEEFILKGI